jgi:hypothetical protein
MIFDNDNSQVDHCQVTQVKTQVSPRGRVGLQVGSGAKKIKNVRKAEMAQASKAGKSTAAATYHTII